MFRIQDSISRLVIIIVLTLVEGLRSSEEVPPGPVQEVLEAASLVSAVEAAS